MTAALAAALGLFGLAVGSFLNVVAYRVPLGRSVVRPPSACPSCGARIRPADNVPVVSWFLLRGRCRHCGEPISARYPTVETATALLFAATVVVVGVSWVLPAYLWFGATTLVLILTDLDHQRIPNRILYPATAVAAVLLTTGGLLDGEPQALARAFLGGIAYFALLLLLAVLARGGFGMGDVKLSFLLGGFLAYRSWEVLLAGGFLAFLIGGVLAVLLLATGRKGRKDAVPFGPSLVLGAWIGIAWGTPLVAWYRGVEVLAFLASR